ncbi:unnamed protein product [Nyctereutes procyonoides]|uniref:(raccoon dog) hypothetical protein n=1 Tax=Nyctereutes procyonoides TaxID=34880 RepID=A0A811XYE5_NYCPR|nr:unnamed protein product [Nyctereutes procyonoides]
MLILTQTLTAIERQAALQAAEIGHFKQECPGKPPRPSPRCKGDHWKVDRPHGVWRPVPFLRDLAGLMGPRGLYVSAPVT